MGPSEVKPGRIHSIVNDGKLFVLHLSLTILVTVTTLFLIQSPGGDRVFNLNHRQPHFSDPDGEKVVAGISAYKPLQNDVITALSIAATATGAAALGWSADLLWHCAFIFKQKDEISDEGFAKVVTGNVKRWPSLNVSTKRKNVLIVYLIIFGCFVMNYFSSILTGSIIWEPALIWVRGFDPVVNITEGLAGVDISWYRNEPVYVSDATDLGACLALVPWGNPNSNASNLPLPSNLTRRAIIQDTDVQTIQYVSVGSTLDTIRLPYFKVEKFEYLTNPAITLTSQQKSLLNDSSAYNPYLLNRGFAALLPDTAWVVMCRPGLKAAGQPKPSPIEPSFRKPSQGFRRPRARASLFSSLGPRPEPRL